MEIIRGTTPTLLYTFQDIDPGDVTFAYLLIKQQNATKIEKGLSDATVTADTQTVKGNISFTLSQAETLTLSNRYKAVVSLDWKLSDGTRGRSNVVMFTVEDSGKNEVV